MSEKYIIIQVSPESFPDTVLSREDFGNFISFLRATLLKNFRELKLENFKFTLIERSRGPIEVTLSSSSHGLPSVRLIYEKIHQCLSGYLAHPKAAGALVGEIYEEVTH